MRNGRKKERPSARKASSASRAAASAAPAQPVGQSPRRKPLFSRKAVADAIVCLLLVAAVFVVFGQTVSFAFINLDDNDYVFKNPHLAGGFSRQGIVWAFTNTRHSAYWAPLTWLSLMLDSELYGLDHSGGYHLTNVMLHAASSVVLFLLLRQMTGGLWPSAFAAAVFAVHPTRVESVAWVTERKDVLSGLFGLLAMWAYARYARSPSVGRYLPVAIALALGLMAKPMLVTWPFLFLLLDYWPLQRRLGPGVLLEKVPLLLLVAASSTVTIIAQRSGGAIVSLQWTSISERICRAAVLYWVYLSKTFWPLNLAACSGYSGELSVSFWPVLSAGMLLALLTGAAVWGARGDSAGWWWAGSGSLEPCCRPLVWSRLACWWRLTVSFTCRKSDSA